MDFSEMTPQLERDIKRWMPIIVIFMIAIISVSGVIVYNRHSTNDAPLETKSEFEFKLEMQSEPAIKPDVQLVWKLVNANNVLFWPVVNNQCVKRNAYYQLHTGTKVLVIHEHDDGMVEVELEDQTKKYTHGCIHSSLLRD